jgi:hypothetical protein
MSTHADKRAWEIGAATLLLLAVVGVAAGFFAWWERQRRLDAEVAAVLTPGRPTSQDNCDRILSLLRQGADVDARSRTGWTVLMEAAAVDHPPGRHRNLPVCAIAGSLIKRGPKEANAAPPVLRRL